MRRLLAFFLSILILFIYKHIDAQEGEISLFPSPIVYSEFPSHDCSVSNQMSRMDCDYELCKNAKAIPGLEISNAEEGLSEAINYSLVQFQILFREKYN